MTPILVKFHQDVFRVKCFKFTGGTRLFEIMEHRGWDKRFGHGGGAAYSKRSGIQQFGMNTTRAGQRSSELIIRGQSHSHETKMIAEERGSNRET